MKKIALAPVCCGFLSIVAQAQQAFGPWIDAAQFGKGDICLDIQAAIASLPLVQSGTSQAPAPGGAVIDARNFAPPPVSLSQSFLHCSVNPFSVAGAPANTIVLASGGDIGGNCNTTLAAPGCLGGVVLLPGFTISTDVPWLVPGNWSVIGQGGKVTVLAPSSAFNTNLANISAGTIGTTSANVGVTGSGTGWTSNVLGMIFTACSTAVCDAVTTSYSNATVVGIVTKYASSTSLNLGTGAQATLTLTIGPPPCCYYVLQAPVMAWATTASCTSCTGALVSQMFGSVIQDIGLDCSVNSGGATVVSGCIPFWDQYGQERSQLKRVRISGFLGAGVGIYTINAQNGGPLEDLQMVAGTSSVPVVATTTCIEVGGMGSAGTTMGQPPMRGVRGLTCTAADGTGVGIGVDINTQNFSLSDAHFEDYNVGVEIGDITSARGVWLSDITGGPRS